jgi:GNAT superfamily N-acetyltransferase
MTIKPPFQPIFHSIDRADSDQINGVVDLWNAACGTDLAISPRFATYNLQPSPGGLQSAWLALVEDQPVGFVSASYLNDPTVASHAGWIDAIAVAPNAQRQGVGTAMLHQAEAWLKQQGSQTITIGAGLHPFVPGVPERLETVDFFKQHGYGTDPAPIGCQWDVAANLATYKPPATVREVDAVVRPAQPDDHEFLLSFLQREFPTHWRYAYEEYRAAGGRVSDYMVLWTERGIDGCCLLTFEDSLHPIERYYPYRLPRPWGHLGSIGISKDRRGQGLGAALLDAGLRRLHNNGVNGCVIDWTDLLDFYAKFGFNPYRSYWMISKSL